MNQELEFLQHLLPNQAYLRLENWHLDLTTRHLELTVSSRHPYKLSLLKQWHAGQRQTKRLFEEIQQQGYHGTSKTVAKYTHQLRQTQRQQLSTLEGRGPALAVIPKQLLGVPVAPPGWC